HAVETQADLRFHLVPRYAGDQLTISIRRGPKESDHDGSVQEESDHQVELAGELPPYRQAFLGILPTATAPTDDTTTVAVRAVWPESPAARAGIQPGDRIKKIGDVDCQSRTQAAGAVRSHQPGDELEITLDRDDQEQ